MLSISVYALTQGLNKICKFIICKKNLQHLIVAIILSLILYYPSALTALSGIYCGVPSHLRIVDEFETDDCNLTLLEDCSRRSVLIKMIRSLDPEEQALLIIDSCAAAIAKTISLPINQVKLLPNQEPWSECEWYKQLATLHEFAQGQSTEESLPWEGFTMQQRYLVPGSPEWKTWGPLPDDAKGLSQEVIATIACHDDLARIAAFDTFVGNADRSLPNLYYCKKTKRFFGIDLAASFRRPLAKMAINQLKKLNKNGFSKKEVAGLKIYHQTLVELQKAVSPSFVKCLLESLEKQSKLKGISHRIHVAAENFSENYTAIIKLIDLLEAIFEDPIS